MDNIDFENRLLVAHSLKKRWYYKPDIPFYIILIFLLFYSFAPNGEAFAAYVSQASYERFLVSYAFIAFVLLFCISYSYFHFRFALNMLIIGKKKLFF